MEQRTEGLKMQNLAVSMLALSVREYVNELGLVPSVG